MKETIMPRARGRLAAAGALMAPLMLGWSAMNADLPGPAWLGQALGHPLALVAETILFGLGVWSTFAAAAPLREFLIDRREIAMMVAGLLVIAPFVALCLLLFSARRTGSF